MSCLEAGTQNKKNIEFHDTHSPSLMYKSTNIIYLRTLLLATIGAVTCEATIVVHDLIQVFKVANHRRHRPLQGVGAQAEIRCRPNKFKLDE